MLFLTKLAFKNLARHRNRTVITAMIIALAVFIYIFYDSLLSGMTVMSYGTLIDYETGHLQVVNRAYWDEEEKLPLKNLLTVDETLQSQLRNVRGFVAASPELNFQARLSNGWDELPVMGKGIEPEAFKGVFALEDQLVAGEMFAAGEHRAVLGKRLADLLDLTVGDYITMQVKDKNKGFNTLEVEIAGLVHTSNPNVNQNIVYVPLDLAQEALAVEGQVSKVILRLAGQDRAAGAAAELERSLKKHDPDLAAYPWNQLEAFAFFGAVELEKQVILAIILLIAAIAIINTVILAALERMGEIGMMKALGLQKKEVVYTFVMESTGIGLLGGSIGILLGMLLVWFLAKYGIDFGALVGIEMSAFGLPVLGKIYGVWNPQGMLEVFAFGVGISFLASLWPAYWAAGKDPVKAIDHH